jgi:6-phosphogluconolactonase (cycloisomerase 2 family)
MFCIINFGCDSSDNRQPVFAYVTNNDVSSISVFSVDTKSGELSPTQVLATPGGGATYGEIHPSGRFLFVTAQFANSISSFAIDPVNGTLSLVPGSTVPTGTGPFNITLDPEGHFLYVANVVSNSVSAYVVNNNGTLDEIAGSPFASGRAPYSLVTDNSGRFLYVTNQTLIAFRVMPSTTRPVPCLPSPAPRLLRAGAHVRSSSPRTANSLSCPTGLRMTSPCTV